MLTIENKTIAPDIVVLQLTGRLVLGRNAQELEWKTADLVAHQQKKVIFDLSGVERVDSTGLGILVQCSARIRTAGGELRIAGAPPAVDEVLRMTNVNQILRLYASANEAAQNFVIWEAPGQS